MKANALVVLGSLLWSTMSLAGEDRNVLGDIQVQEQPEGTLITITGSTTPTFSVFRLEDPPRLFIDVAGGELGARSRTVEIFNGVVAQVGTIAYGKEGAATARVVVTFERAAAYDVRAAGDDILILVDGEGRVAASDRRGEEAARERELLEKAIQRERVLLEQLRGAREQEEALRETAARARLEEQEMIRSLETERARIEALRGRAEEQRLRETELSEVAKAERARAEEERSAAQRLAQLEREKLEALKTERKRQESLEKANRSEAAAAASHREAEERAARLADQRKAALEEERRRADEAKTATELELAENQRKLALAQETLRLEQEKAAALAEVRRMEEQKSGIAREARSREEALLDQARAAREEQERIAEELKQVTREARRLQLEAERNAQVRRLAEIEQEKAEAEKSRLVAEAAAEEARLRALREATAREADLKTRLDEQRRNQEALEAAARKKLEATEARLAAAKVAVQREEERLAAQAEANRREEKSAAARRESEQKKKEHKEALAAQAAVEEALLEARQTRETAAREKERLAAIVAERSNAERQLASTRAGKARAEAERAEVDREIENVQARLRELEAARTEKHGFLQSIEKEIGTQREAIEAVNAQLVLERDNLDRMVAERKAEEARLDELRQSIRDLEARKDGAESERIRELRKELSTQEAALRERDLKLGGLEERLQTLEKEAAEARTERARSEALASALEARNRDLDSLARKYEESRTESARSEALASALEARNRDLDSLARKYEESRQHLDVLQSERADRESAAGRLEEEMSRTSAELERVRADYQTLVSEREHWAEMSEEEKGRALDLRTRVEAAQDMVDRLRAERDRKAGELAELGREIERHGEAERRLRGELDEARAAAAQREAEAGALRSEVERQEQALQALRAELDEKTAAVADLQARVDASVSGEESAVRDLSSQLAAQRKEAEALALRVRSAEAAAVQAASLQGLLQERERELATLKSQMETSVDSSGKALQAMADDIAGREAEMEQTRARLAAQLQASAEAVAFAEEKSARAIRSAEEKSARAIRSAEETSARAIQAAEETSARAIQAAEERSAKAIQDADAARKVAEARAEEASARADAARKVAEARGEEASARADAARKVAEARAEEASARAEKASARADAARKVAEARAEEASARAEEASARAEKAARQAEEARTQAREAEAGRKNQVAAVVPLPEATPEAAPGMLRDVQFDGARDTGVIRIITEGAVEPRVVAKGDRDLVMVLDGVGIPAALERTLDTTDFGGPVAWVSSFRNPSKVGSTVVSVHLSQAVQQRVVQGKDGLEWRFGETPDPKKVAGPSQEPQQPEVGGVGYHPQGVGAGDAPAGAAPGAPAMGAGSGIDSPFAVLNPRPGKKKQKYTGRRINLAIKDADIQHVLAFLARVGGVNIVSSKGVAGTVSFYLEDVPWDLALDMILKTSGMDYVKEEGIYRVAPVVDIQKEYDLEVEKRRKITELKQLQVKLIPVNYAKADTLVPQIQSILSAKGKVSTDSRTNTVIVKDIEEHVMAVEDLCRRLDAQTPQVLIEARIVEASNDFSYQLGVQWGGNALASPALGNETGLIFPSTIGLAGGASGGQTNIEGLYAPPNPNFAVNLPAAAGAGAGGAIGLTLGSIGQAANLYLRLSAAEEEGTVKIISAPRISTTDNEQATIQQGVSFPVSVVSAQGVNTQFFDAQLSLSVTPHVTQDGNIQLDVNITKNEPDFSAMGANGNPTIRKKEARTKLLLKDGDTTVIGGIFARSTTKNFKKIPFFADLPLVGFFFRNTSETDRRSEMLIFITPRIVNRQAAKVNTSAE